MAKGKTSYLLLSVASGATLASACGGDDTSGTGTTVSCDAGACANAGGDTGTGGAHPPGVVINPGTGGAGGVPPGVVVNPGTGGHRIIGVVPLPVGTGGTSTGGTSAGGAGGGGAGGVPPGVIINPGSGGRQVIGVVPVPTGSGGIPFPGIIIRPPDGGV